uniref:Uncharacterized protein n=1 Tax=Setaria italica TaxID=4555 RepID=K3XUN8_SETIT
MQYVLKIFSMIVWQIEHILNFGYILAAFHVPHLSKMIYAMSCVVPHRSHSTMHFFNLINNF